MTASNFYRLRYGQKREKVDEQQDFPTTLGDAVARMFTLEYNPTWGEFASTKWYNEGNASMTKGFLSLEYIHNNMHVRKPDAVQDAELTMTRISPVAATCASAKRILSTLGLDICVMFQVSSKIAEYAVPSPCGQSMR